MTERKGGETPHAFDGGPHGIEWQCMHIKGHSPYGSPLYCNKRWDDPVHVIDGAYVSVPLGGWQ